MKNVTAHWNSDSRLAKAHKHAQSGEVLQAELLYRAVLRDHPDCTPAARAVATFAVNREDYGTARQLLEHAAIATPSDHTLQFELAQVLWHAEEPLQAIQLLKQFVREAPAHYLGWMLLGDILDACGNGQGALRAWYQSVKIAQEAGVWLDRNSTDPAMVEVVMRRIETLNRSQRTLLFDSFSTARAQFGNEAMARLDHALCGYLGDWVALPPDPRQRPKFFFFPDLPGGPYHDPYLHDWASGLRDAWQDMRDEATELLATDRDFESFLGLKPGQDKTGYVGGTNPNASWDAFFLYRHGKRFDANHLKCPKTSKALDSVDLCRVNNQAPEICFSVIRPQSTIEPHYGVTNTRLVLHLPLIVPQDCALDVIGGPTHHWKAGEPMMFDDTFQHGAWNRSNEPRLILLMDCWNPHLTVPERRAIEMLFNTIDDFGNIDAASR